MRAIAIASLVALSACGAPVMQASNVLPDDNGSLAGPIVAVGEDWRVNDDPWSPDNTLSIYMDDGTEVSGTWVRPYYVDGHISAGDIRMTLENAACVQDTISYPMRATVTFPGQTLTGCAAMRWDYQVDTLIDEIDACIAEAPEWRTVTYAGELPDGSVLVRVRNGDDMRDCRVERERVKHSPRDESFLAPTENAAIFLRARPGETENPGGECYDAPEVLRFGHHFSEMVGWLLEPQEC
jgi:hypothetical protein